MPTTSTTTAAWLAQATKDLKGRLPEELRWNIAPDLVADPFVTADDFATPPAPPSGPNAWQIGEHVPAHDPAAANAQALEALNGGAEALTFVFEQPVVFEQLAQVLEGIYLDFVSLHFAGPGVAHNPGALLAFLQKIAAARGIPTQQLRGSLGYDPLSQATLQDWRYLAELLAFGQEAFPQFRLITLSETRYSASQPLHGQPTINNQQSTISNQHALADLLQRANRYFQHLQERGVPPAQVAAQLQLEVAVGKDYWLEIARLRALKLLWLNVLQAWGAPLTVPQVAAVFDPAAYDEAVYTNLVRASTLAMSAVLGGAQQLTVLPYDAGRVGATEHPAAFGRRMARNVQHLLKMESHLDEANDPAAGSFYLERLTQQLAAAAWGVISERQA